MTKGMDRRGLPAVASRWRVWMFGTAAESSTSRDAEMTLALFVAGLRCGLVAQMVPTLWQGISESPQPTLYVFCWVGAAMLSAITGVRCILTTRPPGSRWMLLDVMTTVAIVLIGTATVPADGRNGTWSAFFPGYVVAVLLTIGVLPKMRGWLTGVAILVSVVLIYLVPTARTDGLPDVISNVVTYMVVAGVTRVAIQALRRIAAAADVSRRRAGELARQGELRRARGAFHNGVALMRMLSESEEGPDAPRGSEDLRRLARKEAGRMRAYLHGEPERVVSDDDHGLSTTLTRVCRGFDDLDVELVTDLAAGVRLAPAPIAAIETALTSLLLNVREHADAESVVVHADVDAGTWMVTVHDDGRGFDTRRTDFGVGLRDAVMGTLEREGMSVQVESDLGLGTIVTISSAAR